MQNHQNATIMNKGNHSIPQDENLREALRQDEAALPQMPADLNDRLMKCLHHEKRQRHFTVWPWVAAACVAAIMVVLLLSPKESCDEAMTGSGELAVQTNSLANEQGANNNLQEAKDIASTTTERAKRITNPNTPGRRIANSTEQENPDTRDRRIANSTERTTSDEMSPSDLPHTQPAPQQVVLTERDIPISRPENYRYTPEELALMRQQANEAYVKWMELEMEIIKYQYEQIAKQ